jgi:hypothetical protein
MNIESLSNCSLISEELPTSDNSRFKNYIEQRSKSKAAPSISFKKFVQISGNISGSFELEDHESNNIRL